MAICWQKDPVTEKLLLVCEHSRKIDLNQENCTVYTFSMEKFAKHDAMY